MSISTEAREYLAAIVTSSDDAIISKDLNGKITSWNPAAERIFGYSAEEAIGQHITIIVPDNRHAEEKEILATLRQGNHISHFETMRRHKDGHLVPVSITVSPIRDAKGRVIGASKISRDISERVQAREALKEMEHKKEEFIANISHELRTPMNAVIGLANLLQYIPLPEQARKFVDTLKVSADHMMDLVNDLLDFSKIESDSMSFESVEFNLAEEVEKAVSVIAVKAKEKKLRLYTDCTSILRSNFIGDPLRIHQIVMNLLSNAVKFTERGSIKVEVSSAQEAQAGKVAQVTIKVKDTGIGIAKDKIDRIFDKFMQADSSITRRYGGSGLGLSIVKALVKKMGGDIHVESELGKGTVFTVMLPLKIAQKSTPAHTRQGYMPASVSEENILLVDDYEPNILVSSAMLESLGYHYEIAHNGLEALEKFAHGHYDVILMDVQMQGLDGLEAARRIRRLEAEKGLPMTPIIALTAHAREQDRDKCLEAGMNDFIPKPFDPGQFARTIQRHIKEAA